MIPDVPREALLDALWTFDDQYRGRGEWANWEANAAHKYAISHEGGLYPVKFSIALAAGVDRRSFSGGDPANSYVEARGFTVVPLHEAARPVALDARRPDMAINEGLETVLGSYGEARQSEAFGRSNPLWGVFSNIQSSLAASPSIQSRPTLEVSWSMGAGNWAKVPWIAFLDSGETKSTQRGVYVVYLFRQDMAGVYLTFNQGVTELRNQHGVRESRKILLDKATALRDYCSNLPARGFSLDNEIDLRTDRGLGAAYESSTVAHKFYPAGEVPDDATLISDLDAVLNSYDQYLSKKEDTKPGPIEPVFLLADSFDDLVLAIRSRGFHFEPWQIAQFITAVRTKPFIILAGVTGTGKSKLPALVAAATGAEHRLIPVRPDWTDSADVLGYVDLEGRFRAGAVMEVLRQAADQEDQHWFCIVDEMNLARVEQYFAEVLSRIEERKPVDGGGYASPPLLGMPLPHGDDSEWAELGLPRNVTIVGTVNMDETTHGFSRKVLDRAFTIELSDVDLSIWGPISSGTEEAGLEWPLSVWQPRAPSLGRLPSVSDADREKIENVVETLSEANTILSEAQLQVGYRTRDEIALFLLHAAEVPEAFKTAEGDEVDPLDLAIQMKVLPRIIGGSGAVRRVLLGLLGWANTGSAISSDSEAREVVDGWIAAGRGGEIPSARFPRTAARLCLMWERLEAEGFTSFWL